MAVIILDAVRRSKVDNLLNKAAGTASRQDMRDSCQVVGKLAPKQKVQESLNSQQDSYTVKSSAADSEHTPHPFSHT